MRWEIAIYKSIKILQAKKLQTVVRKIVLSVSANAIIQLNHNWLHSTGCIWTSVSCYRQLYSLCKVGVFFSFPRNSAELVLMWRSLLWLEHFIWIFKVFLLVENLSCIILELGSPAWWRCLFLSSVHGRDHSVQRAESRPKISAKTKHDLVSVQQKHLMLSILCSFEVIFHQKLKRRKDVFWCWRVFSFELWAGTEKLVSLVWDVFWQASQPPSEWHEFGILTWIKNSFQLSGSLKPDFDNNCPCNSFIWLQNRSCGYSSGFLS